MGKKCQNCSRPIYNGRIPRKSWWLKIKKAPNPLKLIGSHGKVKNKEANKEGCCLLIQSDNSKIRTLLTRIWIALWPFCTHSGEGPWLQLASFWSTVKSSRCQASDHYVKISPLQHHSSFILHYTTHLVIKKRVIM